MRILALLVSTCVLPHTAHADEWYGKETLGSDAAAYTLLGTGLLLDNPVVGAGGAVLWLLGPAAIHLSHGEKGRAALSLGGRVFLPLVGAGVGVGISADGSCCCDHTCKDGLDGAVIGFVCGVLAASILDAVIAREERDQSDAVMFTIGGGF